MRNLYFPAFVGGQRHGGIRRSEQIANALASLIPGAELECIPPPDDFKRLLKRYVWKHPFQLAKALYSSHKYESGWRNRIFWALCSIYYGHACSLDSRCLAWIEYSSSFSRYISDLAQRAGAEYVLFPHNIEFLVRGGDAVSGREFERETAAIAGACQCRCISDFDAAICEVFNQNTNTFPYFPSESDLAAFARIKDARTSSSKTGFLAIGSATNPSTKQGFVDLVEILNGQGVAGDDLIVAGYGTESLHSTIGARAKVLGSIAQERLESLLKTCRGVVVFQRQSSGFLTRLVEMNLCGIPVLVAGGYRQAVSLEKYGIYSDVGRFIQGQISCATCFFEKPELVLPPHLMARMNSALNLDRESRE